MVAPVTAIAAAPASAPAAAASRRSPGLRAAVVVWFLRFTVVPASGK